MIPRAFFWLSFLNLLMPGRTQPKELINKQSNEWLCRGHKLRLLPKYYYKNSQSVCFFLRLRCRCSLFQSDLLSYGVILPFDFSTQWAVFALILIVVFPSRPRLLLRVLLLVSHTLVYWADAVFLVHCTSTVVVLWESFRASLLFWSYMDRVS